MLGSHVFNAEEVLPLTTSLRRLGSSPTPDGIDSKLTRLNSKDSRLSHSWENEMFKFKSSRFRSLKFFIFFRSPLHTRLLGSQLLVIAASPNQTRSRLAPPVLLPHSCLLLKSKVSFFPTMAKYVNLRAQISPSVVQPVMGVETWRVRLFAAVLGVVLSGDDSVDIPSLICATAKVCNWTIFLKKSVVASMRSFHWTHSGTYQILFHQAYLVLLASFVIYLTFRKQNTTKTRGSAPTHRKSSLLCPSKGAYLTTKAIKVSDACCSMAVHNSVNVLETFSKLLRGLNLALSHQSGQSFKCVHISQE